MKTRIKDKLIWIISLILAILALISHFIYIPVVTKDQFWILLAAWLILFLRLAKKRV